MNTGPRDQEAHAFLTEPAKHPGGWFSFNVIFRLHVLSYPASFYSSELSDPVGIEVMGIGRLRFLWKSDLTRVLRKRSATSGRLKSSVFSA